MIELTEDSRQSQSNMTPPATPSSKESTGTESKWLSSMQKINLSGTGASKVKLVADLCQVLGTLQFDPVTKVAETVTGIITWLQVLRAVVCWESHAPSGLMALHRGRGWTRLAAGVIAHRVIGRPEGGLRYGHLR